MNVSVLTGSAGLFFVFSLYVGSSLDSLSVGYLLRDGLHFYAESVFQLGKDNPQLNIATKDGSSSLSLLRPVPILSSSFLSMASMAI